MSEAAIRAVLSKMVFLKIFQASQENTCVEVSFLIEPSGLQLYFKKSPVQVFSCGICENFKNIYFEENLRTTASETCSNLTRTVLF